MSRTPEEYALARPGETITVQGTQKVRADVACTVRCSGNAQVIATDPGVRVDAAGLSLVNLLAGSCRASGRALVHLWPGSSLEASGQVIEHRHHVLGNTGNLAVEPGSTVQVIEH